MSRLLRLVLLLAVFLLLLWAVEPPPPPQVSGAAAPSPTPTFDPQSPDRPTGDALQLRQAEALLLEYLSQPAAARRGLRERLDQAEVLLLPLVEDPNRLPTPFAPRMYMTFLTEERGQGDFPKDSLNHGLGVLYDFVFEHPDRPAAEYLGGRLGYPSDYAQPQLYQQVGGGGFDSNREATNADFLAFLGDLEGTKVTDLGGGLGLLAWQIARRVGPEGRVTIVELDPHLGEFVEYTKQRPDYRALADRVSFQVAASPTDPGVREQDLVTMQDVHILCDREYYTFGKDLLPGLRRALRPGGRLLVVESFRQDITRQVARERLEEAGFRVTASEALLKHAGFLMIAERTDP